MAYNVEGTEFFNIISWYKVEKLENYAIVMQCSGVSCYAVYIGKRLVLVLPEPEICNCLLRRVSQKEDLLCGQCAKCTFGKKCKAGCTSMAISSTDSMGDNAYCVRRLEEKCLQDLFG